MTDPHECEDREEPMTRETMGGVDDISPDTDRPMTHANWRRCTTA